MIRLRFSTLSARRAAGAILAATVLLPAAASAQGTPEPAPAPAPPAPTGQTVPPVVIEHVEAIYPPGHAPSEAHANVVLTVTVDVDGHVTNVEVAESAGKELDEAATIAMRQWTFKPALRNGKPVASRIKVPFHFVPPTGSEGTPEQRLEGASNTGVGAAGPITTSPDPSATPPPAPTPAPAPGAPPEDPDTVLVSGRAPPPSRGASDFNLRVGALSNVPRQNATELLKLAPGILLTNEGGDGHAEQIFLRGFDAREGQDVELTVGGVPVNEAGNLHGNGYADLHFILPELVESLRVVEGPFDPRQGNFAVAGSANYELGLERRGLTAKYMRGSFGTERMLLLWGPKKESTHTFGGVELFDTKGFGQNRDARRGTAMGQYEGRLGEKGSYRVTATAYSSSYHSAGLLRQDDYASGRKGFYDTYDARQGGESSRYSLSGDIETKSGDMLYRQSLFVISRSMRLRENFTGYLLDVQTPLQSPHPQRGDLLDLSVSSLTFGAKGSARYRARLFNQPQEIELGYFARGDTTASTQHRVETATSVPYLLETDLQSKLGNIGLYGDVNARATPWLSLRGGARADLFTYDVLDQCAAKDARQPSRANPPGDASCLDQQDFGRHREPVQRSSTASTAVMPRASLIVGPLRDFTFNLSYGIGARSIDPVYISQDIRTPFSKVEAYEAGAAYSTFAGNVEIVARGVFFQTKVERDLIFSQTAGRNTLANGTTRTGGVASVRFTGPWFDQAAHATLVRSTFDEDGLLVPYVPDVVVRSDTSVWRDLPFRILDERLRGALSAGVTFVGRRPLPFGQRSNRVFTVDTSATVSWKGFEAGFIVTNLLDARYRLGEYNYASDFRTAEMPTLVPARHFSAGAPRSFFFTLSATLGGT